ncbi:hypothetical protein GQ44DRAFT_629403 [Phaeosphaeriaceae sp. PMI808]|nr:hypothetical protein GQ44DRAFT_629403 [Phaeosphaeriaceae sp. PMI808]
MATFLFPPGKHAKVTSTARHKSTAIPRNLFSIVRAATDSADALELFVNLIQEAEQDLTSPGFLAFDAHVGDTACQLRACMLLEIVNRYQRLDPLSTELCQTKEAVEHLRAVATNAQNFCKELCDFPIRKASVEALGVSKHGMTMDEILQRVGWLEATKPKLDGSREPLTLPVPTPLSETSSMEFNPSPDGTQTSYSTPPSSASSTGITNTAEQRKLASPFSAGVTSEYWMPWNLNQVVHFLIYCYILSKYKEFVVRSYIYGASIRPELAFQVSHKMMDGKFPKPYDSPTKRPIEQEFQALQSYTSDLSCAWLGQMSKMFCPDRQVMTSLLEKSKRFSVKGVHSVPSYVGYLVLRELWAQTSTPIILVSRRFCASGTIAGETEQYLERLSTRMHNDDCCANNIEHCNTMLAADQDRVTLALFADHKHYAFPLSGEEANVHEDDVVKRVMDEVIPGLSQQWRASKDEARILGTGPSLRTFMWQHVALESPARFLRLLDKTDRPIILGAPVIDYDVLRIKKIDGFDNL